MKFIHEDSQVKVVIDTDFENGCIMFIHDKILKQNHPLVLPEAIVIPENLLIPISKLLIKTREFLE